uniref:Uncharacterized protein n=1 Tax=Oryza nivara TaxID=4536 RepID=A0A0E0IIP7_ORYNI
MQIRPSLMASFVGWMMIGDTVDLILLAPEMAPDLVHRLASGGFVHRLEEERSYWGTAPKITGNISCGVLCQGGENKKLSYGTVTGVNCKWLAAQPGVDGFLVSGASLKKTWVILESNHQGYLVQN